MKTILVFLSIFLFTLSNPRAESYNLGLSPYKSYNAYSYSNNYQFSPRSRYNSINSDGVKTVAKKIYDTSWIDSQSKRYGLVLSFSLAQFITGMTEGYHFNSLDGFIIDNGYIVNDSNYHAYQTLGRAAWVTTGYFVYANIDDDRTTWYGKGGRIIGSALIARDFFEWGYRWNRWDNPFDYYKEHNEHSIVYFKISKGEIIDAYIGTGKTSGPIVDAACLVVGYVLINIGDK